MVKRSTKSKSKRVSLKRKHKIIKKVKDHHKKKAKEAKKLGHVGRKKIEKDPGIPNDWPFKEQELKALEIRRERAIEEIEQKKVVRKERAKRRKLGLPDDEDVMNDTMVPAENNARTTHAHVPSEKAFFKELGKVIEASDVILEVLDARDPIGTRCADMEKMAMKSDPNKRIVLLLNKIDLVPREAAEKWLAYLREELPTVAFKCNTQEQRSNLGRRTVKTLKSSNTQTSDCLGSETLIKLLKNYSRSCDLKMSLTVGIVGFPNVGKSSLINSLKRSHVVNVGATPGVTRSMQEVHLDKKVKLLDCPGVVMLKSNENDSSVALRNCTKIEKLADVITPVEEILKLCPKERLMSIYNLSAYKTVYDFLQKVAGARGKLKKGGILDTEAAARIVLHDWNEGKIPYFTLPPARAGSQLMESAIVGEFGKEFDVDEVYKTETSFIGSLASVDDFLHVDVPPSSPLNFDEQMQDNVEPESVNEDDQMMATDLAGRADKKISNTKIIRQNEKLYTAEGIFDPHKRRAIEKKRRKAALKASQTSEMDADYDFKIDYPASQGDVPKGVPMDGVE